MMEEIPKTVAIELLEAQRIETKGASDKPRNGDINRDMNADHNNLPVINGWTERMTYNLRNTAFKSLGFHWMFATDALFMHEANMTVSIVSGIITAFIGIVIAACIGFVTIRADVSVTGVIIYYAFYVLQVFSVLACWGNTCLQIYRVGKQWDFKIPQALQYASRFGDNYRKIINQFSREPNDRENALILQDHVNEIFGDNDRWKPFIRKQTTNEWNKYVKNTKNLHDGTHLIELPEEFKDQHEYSVNTRVIDSDTNNDVDATIDAVDEESSKKKSWFSFLKCLPKMRRNKYQLNTGNLRMMALDMV